MNQMTDLLKEYEKKVKGGDPYRGVGSQSFPWDMERAKFKDKEGDLWTVNISCLSLQREKHSDLCAAQFLIKMKCTLCEASFAELYPSKERLYGLGVEEPNSFDLTFKHESKCKVDDLVKTAQKYVLHLRKKVSQNVNPERKA